MKSDVYQRVTDTILAQLEQGVRPIGARIGHILPTLLGIGVVVVALQDVV